MSDIRVRKIKDRNTVEITNGVYRLIVHTEDQIVIAVAIDWELREGVLHVPYIYYGENAYEKYLHFIGKMCLKDSDSKYFGNPVFGEHCKNGKPGRLTVQQIEGKAQACRQMITRKIPIT